MANQMMWFGGRIWRRANLERSTEIVKISTGIGQGNFRVAKKVAGGLKLAASYWEDDTSQLNDIGWGQEQPNAFGYSGPLPETRQGPEELGFQMGDRVLITETLDTFRTPEGYEGGEGSVSNSQGGEKVELGLNEVAEIVGLNQDAQGAPLEGSMLVKLPSGRLAVVFPDEVEKV